MGNANYRKRRLLVVICGMIGFLWLIISSGWQYSAFDTNQTSSRQGELAVAALQRIAIKGRAPKTGYTREQFGNGWNKTGKCDTRNLILYRDLKLTSVSDNCLVQSGTLHDPYTGRVINFKRNNGSMVQIDHVVALSDAWQKGAQLLTLKTRQQMANDPLELLAVSGAENQNKGDSDAASWLPPNKSFRCAYVARQIAVKLRYKLWVAKAERDAMTRVLEGCPNQVLPTP